MEFEHGYETNPDLGTDGEEEDTEIYDAEDQEGDAGHIFRSTERSLKHQFASHSEILRTVTMDLRTYY